MANPDPIPNPDPAASRWSVTFTDGAELEVSARSSYAAERKAESETGKHAFASRPAGCTGLSARAHFGRFCPLHADA